MAERHTRQNDHHGSVGQKPRAGRGGIALVGVSDVIGTSDCWCGKPSGHDWPGKDNGESHPRERKQQ